MAPYGMNSFSEIIIPSVYAPVLLKMNSSMSLRSRNSAELTCILSEHDYSMKPQVPHNGHSLLNSQEYCDSLEADNSCSRVDVMLSCSDVDFHKLTASNEDSDFLMELGELDFDLGVLDPCSDEEMKDSFQEFIDSALEESSVLCGGSQDGDSRRHDEDAALKEAFLANLNLISVDTNIKTDMVESLSMTPVSSLSDAGDICPVSTDISTFETIPTKMCSCLEYDTVSKVVYSTAQAGHEDSVRTCPSSIFTFNECSNCQTKKEMVERFMSPLFIDTSLTSTSQSFPLLSDTHHHHVAIDKNQLPEVDKDTADIMKWLKENHLHDDYNNNSTQSNCPNEISALTQTPSQDRVDLENFVDLEDFLNDVDEGSVDYSYCGQCKQRTTDLSNLQAKDHVYDSQLKLSFLKELPERSRTNAEQMLDSHSEVFSESLTQDSLTPKFSHCISPSWSMTDSTHSSPLGSMTLSASSPWENVFEDSSLKSQLALLKLFSEENAESLLVTDSPLQKERFV